MPPPLKGRGFLILIRVAAAVASLVFAALLLTTVMSVIPGNLEFIPPGEAVEFEFADGVMYMSTNFTIGNNGYHDVTNFSVAVQGVVENQIVVTDYRSPPVNVPPGERRVVDIRVPIDLAPLQNSGYLVLLPGNVTFKMSVLGTTTRGLLDFGISFFITEQFEPLISAFDIDWANSTFQKLDGLYEWSVPYVMGTAPFLTGQANVTISLTNQTGPLANATLSFPLGQEQQGNLTFTLTEAQALDLQASPQTLTMDIELELPGELRFTYTAQVTVGGG